MSVLTEIRSALPRADLVYVADRARAPFGPRPLEEVAEIAREISNWLVDFGANCLVVACNTASAAALDQIRADHPDIPVVGMEPAVKPAAETSATGTVAVVATAATFQGELFASVVNRFAGGVRVLSRPCPEWVELVEDGVVDGPDAESAVREVIADFVEADADRIVLACTHFSFLKHVIERVSGLAVIDPAPAVAHQVARVAPHGGGGDITLAASGDLAEFERLADELAGISSPVIPFAP